VALTGSIAPDSQEGYDVTVSLADGRTIWLSCKRLGRSTALEDFETAAHELGKAMVTTANTHGQHAMAGFMQNGSYG
jgi:hypothetical protein